MNRALKPPPTAISPKTSPPTAPTSSSARPPPSPQGGNDSTGPVSIYDRNLSTGETHVVSNAPAGGPLPCLQNTAQGECHAPKDSNGISELAISADGTHILLGQKVSEDADGNVYYRLYMDINDSSETVELTPGATDGVLFNGMTSDGSEVFFTTKGQADHRHKPGHRRKRRPLRSRSL